MEHTKLSQSRRAFIYILNKSDSVSQLETIHLGIYLKEFSSSQAVAGRVSEDLSITEQHQHILNPIPPSFSKQDIGCLFLISL